ncbi:MAG TPA: hypothetical protein VL461_11165 [Dictyobacter sp.]|nr:hypothetical protein [Dictyobacter sp.]
MRLKNLLWPIYIVCAALAALAVMEVFPGFLFRPLVIALFLFISPGMAMVRFFRIQDVVSKLVIAAALSFSIDGIIVGIYLYANHWSPIHMMITIVAFSIVAVVVEISNIHIALYKRLRFLQTLGKLLTHPLIIGTAPAHLAGIPSNEDVIDKPTVRIVSTQSVTQRLAHASPVRIEETPTVQISVASFKGVNNNETKIEDKPTMHVEATRTEPATHEAYIENRPTMHLPAPTKQSGEQRQQQTNLPTEPLPSDKSTPSQPRTADRQVDEAKREIPVSLEKTQRLNQQQESEDIENKPTRYIASVPVSGSAPKTSGSARNEALSQDIENKPTTHLASVSDDKENVPATPARVPQSAPAENTPTQILSQSSAPHNTQQNNAEGDATSETTNEAQTTVISKNKKRRPARFVRVEKPEGQETQEPVDLRSMSPVPQLQKKER